MLFYSLCDYVLFNSVVIEDDDVNKIADCNKETNTSDERAAAAKEDEWMQIGESIST